MSLDALTIRDLLPNHQLKLFSQRSVGSLHGNHHQNLMTPSKILEGSRNYRFGDPVRMIDWRAFARTKRLIIHEKPNEVSLRVAVFFSLDQSMAWPQQEGLSTKSEIAQRILFHISFFHLDSYDIVDIWFFYKGKLFKMTFDGSRHLLLYFFEQRSAEFSFDHLVRHSTHYDSIASSYDVFYSIGDGFNYSSYEPILKKKKNVFFIHTLSSKELRSDWMAGNSLFFEEDIAYKKEFLGKDITSNYQDRLSSWLNMFQKKNTENGCQYVLFSDETKLAQYLDIIENLRKRGI